jgi:arsenite methyltransferase
MSDMPTNDEQLRAEVSARYAKTALQVLGREPSAAANACCAPTCCTPTTTAETSSRTALPVVEAEHVQDRTHT